MKLVFYGLTITSSWGNGHATTYRSLCKALARRGHQVHFIEKDVEWYRSNRDLPQPAFCTVHLYNSWAKESAGLLRHAADADAIVLGSYFPDAIAATRNLLDAGNGPMLFYDIDTPITVSQLIATGGTEYLSPELIPHYAAYLSFTGGPLLRTLEERFGSPWAVPFYCSVDSEQYKPAAAEPHLRSDLSYLGTFAPDRQAKLMCLLNRVAALLPEMQFLVAGPQYPQNTAWAANVRRIVHLSPTEHPAFYGSSRLTLNLTRDQMIAAGYSPSVRLFEASACEAAILSDRWPGLEEFFTPNEEILLPQDEYEVAAILRDLPEGEAKKIGRRARERILAQHTAEHRAIEFEDVVSQCTRLASL